MKKTNIYDLYKLKEQNKKFASITAYDATFANLFFKKGIRTILVGDSLGMTIQGHSSTVPVKIDEMMYHTKCVRRGAPSCLIISDLPFMSYNNINDALNNSKKLIQSGANIVKLEGGLWVSDIIHELNTRSIPVCGHIGLTPQSINMQGSYKIQGRNNNDAIRLMEEAISIEESGAKLLVLECIIQKLSNNITKKLNIPTIGIGSGKKTDGQILVMQDVLGITIEGKIPSFSKNFTKNKFGIEKAIELYIEEVENELFPSENHSFN
ncbi:panB [Wigglesworthia glossinidia endosymbiont of Glossina brevipalpis]|uniref:3-methyl-2-oxobutanoate hydroxymethyltransferase n=1 Tax=Wigglesworthia glossinidia brevipalpis TaxID=36870 RepID=PANB_WIGBR|nr:RecName: Full=3-methyl-2-oxobutanoate hydroxymethyltransferase; AltName: Full=Ketopantoate hydroxymethyltransferase; Short=KPHMT [Wigglesworthia glossinidia endosymbiont of Glossina brevipalpis]BAC24595.1 panB [Wigglesworthia glossinidia endosymbiont of Glossina brevipalpis]